MAENSCTGQFLWPLMLSFQHVELLRSCTGALEFDPSFGHSLILRASPRDKALLLEFRDKSGPNPCPEGPHSLKEEDK